MQDKFHCSVILLWFDITQAEVIFLRPLASIGEILTALCLLGFFFTLSRMNGKCSTNRASDIWFTVSRRFHFHISRQINRDRYLPKMCAVRPPPSPARETHIDRCEENKDRPQPIHHLFCVECWTFIQTVEQTAKCFLSFLLSKRSHFVLQWWILSSSYTETNSVRSCWFLITPEVA